MLIATDKMVYNIFLPVGMAVGTVSVVFQPRVVVW